MNNTITIGDFVNGKCKAAKETKQFVNDWLKTTKNPCSIRVRDKSKCCFFNKLVKTGIISK